MCAQRLRHMDWTAVPSTWHLLWLQQAVRLLGPAGCVARQFELLPPVACKLVTRDMCVCECVCCTLLQTDTGTDAQSPVRL